VIRIPLAKSIARRGKNAQKWPENALKDGLKPVRALFLPEKGANMAALASLSTAVSRYMGCSMVKSKVD
jgi:hypothetical protein